MSKELELFHWWFHDDITGQRCRTPYAMDRETATQLYGNVQADEPTRVLRTVSEPGEAPHEQIPPQLQVVEVGNRRARHRVTNAPGSPPSPRPALRDSERLLKLEAMLARAASIDGRIGLDPISRRVLRLDLKPVRWSSVQSYPPAAWRMHANAGGG
jgi:hypothetical protein